MVSLQRSLSRLSALMLGLLALLVGGSAVAQTYPSQTVTLIVGFSATGEVGRTAQLMGRWLSERLGQPVVVDNRVGDLTNIATEAVVRSPADGHTLLVANTANAINAALYDKLNFNFIRDITPVAGLVRVPIVLVANPSFPARTVTELIAYAKANPGKVSMAVPSPASLVVAAESFKMMTGLDLVRVPYAGDNPALHDLIAGKVQIQFAGFGAAKEHVSSGKLRAIAVGSATRERVLPDIPTIGEFVPGYEVSAWLGIGAPKNIRADIVERLNREITAGLSDANVQARLADSGHVPMPMTSGEFGKFIIHETDRLGKLVKSTGIKPQ